MFLFSAKTAKQIIKKLLLYKIWLVYKKIPHPDIDFTDLVKKYNDLILDGKTLTTNENYNKYGQKLTITNFQQSGQFVDQFQDVVKESFDHLMKNYTDSKKDYSIFIDTLLDKVFEHPRITSQIIKPSWEYVEINILPIIDTEEVGLLWYRQFNTRAQQLKVHHKLYSPQLDDAAELDREGHSPGKTVEDAVMMDEHHLGDYLKADSDNVVFQYVTQGRVRLSKYYATSRSTIKTVRSDATVFACKEMDGGIGPGNVLREKKFFRFRAIGIPFDFIELKSLMECMKTNDQLFELYETTYKLQSVVSLNVMKNKVDNWRGVSHCQAGQGGKVCKQ